MNKTVTVLFACLPLIACGGEDESPTPTAEVDTFLTVTELVGGDFTVVTAIENCTGSPPARITADGITLAAAAAIEPVTVLQSDGGEVLEAADERARFFMTIPSASLDPSQFGLPVRAEIQVEVECPEGRATSEAVAIQYVPTDVVVSPPNRPNRFWASDEPGDLLVCDDSSLVVLRGGVTQINILNLGFPCTLAEVDGVIGERRYVWGDRFGIAALDVGPSIAWSRSMLIQALWADGTRDPVILRTEGAGAGEKRLYVLDADTGADNFGPIAPAEGRVFLDAVSRTNNGDVLVLEAEQVNDPPSLTYYVRRLDSEGNDINTLQAARYNYDAPTDIASFSFDGTTLFFKDAPDEEETFRIAGINTETGAIRLLSSFGDGWRFPFGDAFGRLLVASESEFIWLDPDTGDTLSQPFSPDSGNSFLRFRVESDGSVVMIADTNQGSSGQGVYVFAPDGSSVMRFSSPRASFSWLAVGWDGTTLFSYFNEVHLIPSRAEYEPAAN